jgi:ABC-type nitrate/sulfonate/bicarbonate transport system permease component
MAGTAGKLTPRTKLLIAIPITAVAVLVLAYFQLFTDPIVIAVIFVLWVAVSLRNRKKFDRQKSQS